MMRVRSIQCASIVAAVALSGCGGGGITNGNAQLPPVSVTPLSGLGKPTFAVGTARLPDGTLGLNVVGYIRKTNGATAYLVDSPSITGPSGFAVPNNAGTAGNADAGGPVINSTPQGGSATSTFGVYGGLFGGGFGPYNASNVASNFYPGSSAPGGPSPSFAMPVYDPLTSGGDQPVYLIIGPPAVTWDAGTFPTGFVGYLPGFLAFEAAPVSGQYKLSVNVPAVNTSSTTITANATLNAGTTLPAIAAPTFTEDAAKDGGGTITGTAAAGATESMVFVCAASNTSTTASCSSAFSFGPIIGSGTAISETLPPGSIGSGNAYFMTIVSFDYPDFEATQPGNKQQTPTVTGAAGQSDVSISPATIGTY